MTKPKIFFMHIGKTGGSYVNDVFIKSIGPENCLVHCEQIMHDESTFRQLLAQKTFVSGHVYYKDWIRLAGQLGSEFLIASVVRSPLKHLKSHLLFVNSLNRPEVRRALEELALGEEVMGAIQEVSLVDFSNPRSIEQFMCSMSPKCMELFNNCQSRYFLCEEKLNSSENFGTDHYTPLLSVLPRFDLIGLNENIDFFLTRLQHMSNVKLDIHGELVEKTASSADIDLDEKLVRRALKRNLELDELLYQKVLEQTTRALSERVVALEGLVLAASELASKAERQEEELQDQLADARAELLQRALKRDAIQAELAPLSAEHDAAAKSLPWRILRKIGRIGGGTSRTPSRRASSS